MATSADTRIIGASGIRRGTQMNKQTSGIVARQNAWGRTPRIADGRGNELRSVPPHFVRLFRWFGASGAERGDAFLDTLPGVMFERD